MTDDTELAAEPAPSSHWIRGEARMRMVLDLAEGGLTYRQIGARYGKKENAVKQFAFQNKVEIAKQRAQLYAKLHLACDGEKRHRVRVLEQIIEEIDDRLADLEQTAKTVDLRFISGQAAWFNYHDAWCRYRGLQAEIVRQIQEELNPRRRAAREDAKVDVDQLFDPVCPQCKEPRSDQLAAPSGAGHGVLVL